MREDANFTSVRTMNAQPADEAARRWRASLPGELRQRSLVRAGVLLSVAAAGYVASMVGAVWLPTREESDRLPRWRRLLEKFYRSPLGSGPSYLIGFYFGYILFPSKERRPPLRRQFEWDRLLVLGFFALQILGMYLLARRTPGL